MKDECAVSQASLLPHIAHACPLALQALFVVPSWFETRLAALLTMRRTGLSIVRIAGLPQAGLASAATPYMRNVEI